MSRPATCRRCIGKWETMEGNPGAKGPRCEDYDESSLRTLPTLAHKGEGAALANPLGKGEERRQVTVHIDRTLDMKIKQVHPRDGGRAEAHGDKSGPHETPVNPVKSLFLVQGQDGHRCPGRGSVVDYVAQKRHVLSDKPTRNPTSLIATDHEVNNL